MGCSGEPDRDWTREGGYRWRSVEPEGFFEQTGFEALDSSQTGVGFENTLTRASINRNRNYTNGSGVAVGDVNGDGWVDLYFGQMDGPNRLYLNEATGGFSFREGTEAAGVVHKDHYTTGVAFADVDGDGDLDLLVASMSKEIALYRNDGTGQFERVDSSGLDAGNGSTTMALADIEGDGDLDLYVTNYKETFVEDLFPPSELNFRNTVRRTKGDTSVPYVLRPPFDEHYRIFYPSPQAPRRRELGAKDDLYLNDGDGTFTKAANLEERFRTHDGKPMGMKRDWGLTAKFQDLDDDGHPDLYVCNDFWTPDRVWMNQGDGTFRTIRPRALRNFSFSSMAVDFSDINADGTLDFFVTEMLATEHRQRAREHRSFDPFNPAPGDLDYQPQYHRNSLYLGRPDHTFAEATYFSNTEATGWSWGTRFLDVNLDGYEDLLTNTGHTHNVLDLDITQEIARKEQNDTEMDESSLFQFPELPLANQALRNDGDRTFTEVSQDWGFSETDISHGLATGDVDRDGDLDLVTTRLKDPAVLYRNTATQPRIAVRLRGTAPNTRAVGAQFQLSGGPVPQMRQMEAGGDYLSSSEPSVVFAAVDGATHRLTITWPDGATTTIDSLRANRVYEIDQPSQEDAERTLVGRDAGSDTAAAPIFRDVSGRLDHTHHERPFNERRVQPLLPLKLSRLGPGVSWMNPDGANGPDLYVSSGAGGSLGIFENDSTGHFSQRSRGPLADPAAVDQTTLLGWTAADGFHVLVGRSNFESEERTVPSVQHYRLHDGDTTRVQQLQGIRSTTGPLAAADYTGNGRLDLFVGGRFKPAQYPEDARSRLYTNEAGTFQFDRRSSSVLRELGLVTSAVFIDYDADGDPDLLCGRAWDSLVLLENRDGRFVDVSGEVGLAEKKGWWNGVATGDFNGDGRPDLVATNWGLNSRYQPEAQRPLKMFYDDYDGDETVEVIESYYDDGVGGYVPYQQLPFLSDPLPSVRKRVDSHADFASSTVPELTGRSADVLTAKEITTLRHTLFLNTDDGFEARPLPPAAQFAPALSAGVADYDNDGHEDLFLSQNMYSLPKLTPRQDAGRGLWLKGDGTGHFTPIDGSTSGIKVYGGQRGAALADINRDGRVDLAVAQNAASTKLYLNQTPKDGLRVRLSGPPSNQDAFGAGLRVVYADGSKGPRRDVQAGSGYWSQDGAVQVLGTAKEPAEIEVTWPDGTRGTAELTSGQMDILIKHPKASPGP